MVHIPKIRPEDLVNPNPITILQRIRAFILGKNKPDKITRFFFYFNLLCWSTFFFWSITGYFSLTFIDNIEEAKRLREIIEVRGAHLGIPDFYGHFKTFLFYMIFTWTFVLFGIVLLWRKKASYVFFYFGGLMLYPIFMWWFLNLSYMVEDVSMFDKVIYVALFLPMVIYHLFFLREKEDALIPEETEL
jgi:hypothetical protein